MMGKYYIKGKVSFPSFLSRRSHNPIERQQVIVYLIATVLVVVGIPLHFFNVVGIDRPVLHLFSAVFFIVTIIPFSLWCGHRLSVNTAFTTAAYAVQTVQSARILFIAATMPKGYYYLVIVNGLVSLILVFLLAVSYLRLATSIVGGVYILTAVIAATVFDKPCALRQFVVLSFLFTIFLSLMSDMMYRNIKHISDENSAFRKGERELLHILRLNRKEINAYIEMCRTDNPHDEDTDRLFSMLSEKSQRNVINAVERKKAIDNSRKTDLQKTFHDFTPMEIEVTRLILLDMKLSQIVELTGKSESNISVVRSHIRKKLVLKPNDDLRSALLKRIG